MIKPKNIIFLFIFILSNSIFTSELNDMSIKKTEKIIFIYNASNDVLSTGFDFIHKIISPSTYQCSLCKVTYGSISMHEEWKEYIENLPFEIKFLYKNNYLNFYKELKPDKFPIAYKYDGSSYEIFISKEEFDSCKKLKELIDMMNKKLNLID